MREIEEKEKERERRKRKSERNKKSDRKWSFFSAGNYSGSSWRTDEKEEKIEEKEE